MEPTFAFLVLVSTPSGDAYTFGDLDEIARDTGSATWWLVRLAGHRKRSWCWQPNGGGPPKCLTPTGSLIRSTTWIWLPGSGYARNRRRRSSLIRASLPRPRPA